MKRAPEPRDQDRSVFGAALERLCDGAPAIAAALVDGEGETVDYAGAATPYAIRVAAAEWQIVLSHCRRGSRFFQQTEELLIRCPGASFGLYALSEGYALVLQLHRGAFALSRRALMQAVREVSSEAGLDLPPSVRDGALWQRVAVREDKRRPQAISAGGTWEPLQIMGCFQAPDLERGEQGYRIRLDSGFETTVIREPLGRWYTDEAWGTLGERPSIVPPPPKPLNNLSVKDPDFPS